jgi:WD40 repeat protein
MRSGLDAMRKIIREREPLTPSLRLTQEATIRTEAGSDKSAFRNPQSAIDKDLDWIVMKCLEKDRTRRYETASGLAADLQRHLDDEPVIARPPSTAYRLQKAWRRNKLLYTAGVAVFLALAVGLTLAAFGWLQALRQRDVAVLARAGEEEQRKQAVGERRKAERATEEARRRAYASEINTAFHALDENNLERAIDLLDRQRPKPGEEDLRGFEWRLLWQRCQSDEKATFSDEIHSSLALSPDGKLLAYGGKRIVIRQLPSGDVTTTIPSAAVTLEFSPDGKLLASGDDFHMKLWNTESWQEECSLADARSPAVFSPDGQWLVTGTAGGYQDGKWLATFANGGYLVWSRPEGTRTWARKGYCAGGPTFTWQSHHGVAFSPNGKLLVTAGHPKGREVAQFQVWDFPALAVRTNFESFPFRLGCAAFAPDNKHLLIGDWTGGLMIWDVAEGRKVETLHEHTGAITAIAYSRDGTTFATSSGDRRVLLWDAQKRTVLVRLRGHLEEVWSVAISPDGQTLASRSHGGTTKLWDASTRHERRMFAGCAIIIGFSDDSRLLVVRDLKDHRLWHRANGSVTTLPLGPLSNLTHTGMDWSDVHGIEPHAVFGQMDGTLEYWNLATMNRVTSWRVSETGVSIATLSPDGRFVATSDEDGETKLWEVATQREVRRLPRSDERLLCAVYSPDGRLLAGSVDRNPSRICIWDVYSGRLLRELDIQDSDNLPSLAFSPDGILLATADFNNTAQLWDVLSGNLRATLKGHVQAVYSVAFSPDGKTLATGGDDSKVKLWNIATHEEMVTLELVPGGCRSLRFSPDGRTLAVGSFLDPEAYMWLWEAPSFEEIAAAEARLSGVNKQP